MSIPEIHSWLVTGDPAANVRVGDTSYEGLDAVLAAIRDQSIDPSTFSSTDQFLLCKMAHMQKGAQLQEVDELFRAVFDAAVTFAIEDLKAFLKEIAPETEFYFSKIEGKRALTEPELQMILRQGLRDAVARGEFSDVSVIVKHFDRNSIKELLHPTTSETSLHESVLFLDGNEGRVYYQGELKGLLRDQAEKVGLELVVSEDQLTDERDQISPLIYPEISSSSAREEAVKANLQRWVIEGTPPENRQEAANKIWGCFINKSEKLAINDLGLTTLPGCLSALTHLGVLHIYRNSLVSLECVSGLRKLRSIVASKNLLTSLEGVSRLGELTHLIVNYNKLTSLIGVSSLRMLIQLDANGNNITSLVGLGVLSHLQFLSANNNRLTSLEEVSVLTNLGSLDVSDNQLISLPDGPAWDTQINPHYPWRDLSILKVSDNSLRSLPPHLGNAAGLRELYIKGNNELSSLPMSLSRTNLFHISATDTQVPVDEVNQILTATQESRFTLAKGVIISRLEFWSKTSAQIFDWSFVKKMDRRKKGILNEFLLRLEQTSDYGASQKELALTVCQIIQSLDLTPVENEETKKELQKREEFSELFFVQVPANLQACPDRASGALNEIYTSWRLHNLSENFSLKEKLEIVAASAKTLALRSAIATKLSQSKLKGETVEVYLFYETLFRQQIDTAVKGHIYGEDWGDRRVERERPIRITKEDLITERDLVDIANKKVETILKDLPQLESILTQNSEYSRDLKSLQGRYFDEYSMPKTDTSAQDFHVAKAQLLRRTLKRHGIELDLVEPSSRIL